MRWIIWFSLDAYTRGYWNGDSLSTVKSDAKRFVSEAEAQAQVDTWNKVYQDLAVIDTVPEDHYDRVAATMGG